MWALFLAIGGLIGSIFYGFFWVMKFCFMVFYKILQTTAIWTKDLVVFILGLPHGWAILIGLIVLILLVYAFILQS